MKRVKAKLHKEKGVFAMSIVDKPAMDSNFIALSKDTPLQFAEVSEERKVLLGAALIPDKPIYRNDEQGEYEIVFEKESIEFAAQNFSKRGYANNTNTDHSLELGGGKAYVTESWIKRDMQKDKSALYGLDEPVGTWFIEMKIEDDEVYRKAKNGELNGFSIEGLFDMTDLNFNINQMSETKEETLLQKFGKMIDEKFKSFTESKKTFAQAKLIDGETVIEYEGETPEAGAMVQIVTEEGNVPAPAGEHELEDGVIIVITEEGIIAEVKEKTNEEQPEEMEDEKVDALLEKIAGMFSEQEKKQADVIAGLEKKFEAIEKAQTEQSEKIEKFAKAPADKKIKSTPTLSKQDLSAMTSKQRILHNLSTRR